MKEQPIYNIQKCMLTTVDAKKIQNKIFWLLVEIKNVRK